MKIANDNHYMLNTDTELLSQLLINLEETGINSFQKLDQKLHELEISSFNDLLNYASGPILGSIFG